MLVESLSLPLSKALLQNSQATEYSIPTRVLTEPPSGDGVFPVSPDGGPTYQNLFLIPFFEGSPEAQFTLRVWGWRKGQPTGKDDRKEIWVPYLLGQITAQGMGIPGPMMYGGGSGQSMLLESEFICFHSYVSLQGAQYFQFDFARLEQNDVAMNCLWARA